MVDRKRGREVTVRDYYETLKQSIGDNYSDSESIFKSTVRGQDPENLTQSSYF